MTSISINEIDKIMTKFWFSAKLKEIRRMSSVEITESEPYNFIIKMGSEVIPFIIDEIETHPDSFLFNMLSKITGENSVSK